MKTLDLKTIANGRWKIGLDESAQIDTVRENRIYYYRILCKYGYVSFHGQNILSAYTGRRLIVKRLINLIPTIKQRGDSEVRVVFDYSEETLGKVLDLLRVRKRRQMSPEEKEKARERFRKYKELNPDNQIHQTPKP